MNKETERVVRSELERVGEEVEHYERQRENAKRSLSEIEGWLRGAEGRQDELKHSLEEEA